MNQPGGDYCSEECATRFAHGVVCPKRWNLNAICAGNQDCGKNGILMMSFEEAAREDLALLVVRMLRDVEKFNRLVVGLPAPGKPTALDAGRLRWAVTALREEVDEFDLATQRGDVPGAADGLVDLVYFALGRLIEMGVPAAAVFDGVHRANMLKQRGELSKRPGSKGFDAVKPSGWVAPDHSFLFSLDLATLSRLEGLKRGAALWGKVSPVVRRAMELREKKGDDYNNVPGGRDAYWVFGDFSFAQLVWTKTLRLVSLVKRGGAPNFESMRDTIVDMVNYLIYWGEDLDKRESGK